MSEEKESLSFTELRKDATTTIVLIHGGFSNSTEWNSAAAILTEYHIILPDMPGHGRSRKTVPDFTTTKAADLIANTVRKHGKNGKAKIVGLSLGAHVALQVITRHPDIVDNDAILTGYNIWSELNEGVFARCGWFGTRIGNLIPFPKPDYDNSIDEDGVKHPPQPWSYWKTVAHVICTEAWPEPWPARTLIIAGLNKGGTPVTDRPVTARKLRDIGVRGNKETLAVGNAALEHPWPTVSFKPELAAQTIRAWFNRQPLPKGFVEL